MSKTGFKGGRLGIGTDDPIYPLDVVGDIRLTGGFRDASGNDFNFIALAGPDIVRSSDLADSITGIICKDNSVGIFNNNPSQSLDVSGNIRLTGDLLDADGAVRVFSNWTVDGTNIFRNSKVTIGDNSVNTNYSLYVNGDVKFSETNVSKLRNHLSSGTGIWYDYANIQRFIINNEEKMRIHSDGNVGIGTNEPSQKLDVNGTARFRTTTYFNGQVYLDSFIYHDGDNSHFGFSTDDTFKVVVNGNNVLYITGTTAATHKLHVNDTCRFTNTATFEGNITASKIGIGAHNSDSTYKLDVWGNARFMNTTYFENSVYFQTSNIYMNSYLVHNGDTDTKIGFPSNDNIYFYCTNIVQMRINSNGIGIHSDAPINSNTRLRVGGKVAMGITDCESRTLHVKNISTYWTSNNWTYYNAVQWHNWDWSHFETVTGVSTSGDMAAYIEGNYDFGKFWPKTSSGTSTNVIIGKTASNYYRKYTALVRVDTQSNYYFMCHIYTNYRDSGGGYVGAALVVDGIDTWVFRKSVGGSEIKSRTDKYNWNVGEVHLLEFYLYFNGYCCYNKSGMGLLWTSDHISSNPNYNSQHTGRSNDDVNGISGWEHNFNTGGLSIGHHNADANYTAKIEGEECGGLIIESDGPSIYANNNIVCTEVTATRQGASSDDRLKHNEKIATKGLDVINKLKLKTYFKGNVLKEKNFNYELDDTGKPITDESYNFEAGFIAQDVMNIPELKHCVIGDEYNTEIITKQKIITLSEPEIDEKGGEHFEKWIEYDDIKKTPQKLYLNYNDIFCYNILATQELAKQQKLKNVEFQNENVTLTIKVTEQEDEIATLKSKTVDFKNKVNTLEAENQELKIKVTTLESTLETVLARLTALENTPTE